MTRVPVNQVVQGDCREVMAGWPDECIDLVVTSPPYWGLRDYGEEAVVDWGDWRGQLGLEPNPNMYIEHLVEIFREVKRILKPSGSFWLNLGDTYYASGGKGGQYERFSPDKGQPGYYRQNSENRSNWLQPKQQLGIPWRAAAALQQDGWILRNCVIWYKLNHMPSSVKDRLTKSYEFIFFLVRDDSKSDYYILSNRPNEETYPDRYERWLEAKEWWDRGVKHVKEIPDKFLDVLTNLDYYFDLDAIRVPHEYLKIDQRRENFESEILDYDEKSGQVGKSRIGRPRSEDYHPQGKNPGDVWEPGKDKNEAATEDGGQGYTKHDLAVGRTGDLGYRDSLHEKAYHHRGKNPGDLWEVNTVPFPGAHFAVFPPDLIEPIVRAGCPEEGVVLDPLCGSGTALRVARKLGRRFIGIDISPEYVEMARHRVRTDDYQPPPEDVPKLSEFTEDKDG